MEACAQALHSIWDALPTPLRGMQLRMSPGRYLTAASGVNTCPLQRFIKLIFRQIKRL